MTITETPATAFEIVLIRIDSRSEDRNEYAITIICDLTKYLGRYHTEQECKISC